MTPGWRDHRQREETGLLQRCVALHATAAPGDTEPCLGQAEALLQRFVVKSLRCWQRGGGLRALVAGWLLVLACFPTAPASHAATLPGMPPGGAAAPADLCSSSAQRTVHRLRLHLHLLRCCTPAAVGGCSTKPQARRWG
eukprot:1159552-Pelagomonas_calceolata.AAC.2